MAIDALDHYAGQLLGVGVERQGVLMGHTELVVFESRGDVGVGLSVYIGVDANADGCFFAQLQSHLVDHFQLWNALHVKAHDAFVQSPLDLRSRFANS